MTPQRPIKPVKPAKAPTHLRPATRQWFEEVAAAYVLESHHLRLLQLAGEAWDRAQEARQALAQHGLTHTDRFGAPRPRPEAAIERDSRIGFARLVRELALDVVTPPEESRPPVLRGQGGLRRLS
jgi:phage terminase small subunit